MTFMKQVQFKHLVFPIILCLVLQILIFYTNTSASSPNLLDPQEGPTPTILPLQEQIFQDDIVAMMQPSDDCPLPCFWDVIPGETTILELRDYMNEHFSGDSYTIEGENYSPLEGFEIEYQSPTATVDYYNINIPLGVQGGLRLTIVEDRNTEKIIIFRIALYDVNKWLPNHQFEMKHIMNSLGEPTRVYIELLTYPDPDLNLYLIRVDYTNQGIMIDYTIPLDDRNLPIDELRTPLQVCPQEEQPIEIEVWIYETQHEEPIEKFIHTLLVFGENYPHSIDQMWELRRFTNFSATEFTQLFLDSSSECIETSLLSMHNN